MDTADVYGRRSDGGVQFEWRSGQVVSCHLQEIDRLISELQIFRERLDLEGKRVQREIVEYATLSQSTIQATKIIAESLSNWKKVFDAPSIADGA